MSRLTPSIDEIFFAAMERNVPEARAAYLDEVCGTDPDLRRRVERLLEAQPRVGSFLDGPAVGPTLTLAAPTAMEGPGTVIGPFKLLEAIGEGGMGIVYMAEQTEPVRRKVALKIIKPGMDSRQVIARFEAERQALAMMDHPNIARVFDAGATESGRPYFIMELVRGVPITEYCDHNRLPIAERLRLFALVCQAVQHAHQKGVIHRDIKPTNVLVTSLDGSPLPKVIDFGIAKATGQSLTEKTLFTGFAQLVGTPLYMSPEQAEMSAVDVDTRSDIYSLGVLLYELLTGTTPFDRTTFQTAALDEVRRIIREQEPPKPSTRLSALGATRTTVSGNRQTDPRKLDRSLRGELDWIVMKALEKDRHRRYETASGLARDVERYLAGEPVEAGPPSAWYRFRKLARRNRVALVTAAVVATTLVLGTAVSTWEAIRATGAERDAATARDAESRARQRAEDAEKTARAEADRARAINQFLTEDLLTQAEPAKNSVEDKVTLLEVVDRAAAKVGDRFRDQPEAESALRMTLSNTYHGLGSFAKAERQAQAALEIEQRQHGPEAAGSFHALERLGHMRDHLGRYSEAIELLRQANEGLGRTHGSDHPHTLTSRQSLASAYHKAGRTAEAIGLNEATLTLLTAKLGPDHPDTLASRHNLAEAYHEAGRIAEAIALDEAALDLLTSKLGPDHPGTLTSRHNLAEAYRTVGRTAEAIALHEKTLQLSEKKLGPDHPITLHSMNNLARLYQDQGQFAKAEPLFLKALEISRARAEENPDTLRSMIYLASLYIRQGQFTKAEPLIVKALEINCRVHGKEYPETLICMNDLGALYWFTGKMDRSVPLFEEVLKWRRAKLGPDHPHTLLSMTNLGVNYRDAGRLPEGIALLEQAWATARKQPDPRVNNLGSMGRHLGEAYERAGELARAGSLYREALEAARERDGETSLASADVLSSLGLNLLRQQRYADAEPLLRKCLMIREKTVPNDWKTFDTKSLLGGSLLGQKGFDEAQPLLLAGFEGMKQREARIPPIVKSRSLAEAVERLMHLYEAWGQPEKAAMWRAQLGQAELPTDVFARP